MQLKNAFVGFRTSVMKHSGNWQIAADKLLY
jgi:hypothetical protein